MIIKKKLKRTIKSKDKLKKKWKIRGKIVKSYRFLSRKKRSGK